MKKIILAIFLMLGVAAFTAPKYIDTSKLKKNSYEILQETEDTFMFGKSTEDIGLTVTVFDVQESEETAKKISEYLKVTAPDNQKYLSSRENKRAYILKFKSQEGGYTYSFVTKNTKVKNCYISIICTTNKEFKDSELDKLIDKILNEIESFLK